MQTSLSLVKQVPSYSAEQMKVIFVVKNDAIWVQREKQMAEDGFIHLISWFKLSGSQAGARTAAAMVSTSIAHASSGLLLLKQF